MDGRNGYIRLILVAKDVLMHTQAATNEDQIRTNFNRHCFSYLDLKPLIAKVEQFDDTLAAEMRRALV